LRNLLKEKLERGEAVVGAFVGLGHPDVTERLSRMGFDWLLLDGEHGPLGLETMQGMMQAMNGSGCTPIVRPQWNDFVVIKRALDVGAHGVLIPWVNSREEAEAAVRACRYPPEGIRGWGPRRAGLVTVQVETRESLENLEEILAVDGIDACFVGPYDLSSNLGLGIPPKFEDPAFVRAMDRVIEASEASGKPAGMYSNMDNISWALERGFTYNTVGEADGFLMYGARVALERMRG
jgi:2-keto-3-deoxy-L-rhamnonate aldolase RhmA